ncbi:tetratricopeptide repeat protein [Haliangium sp.]
MPSQRHPTATPTDADHADHVDSGEPGHAAASTDPAKDTTEVAATELVTETMLLGSSSEPERSADDPTELAQGDELGRYRIEAQLGAGGMGVVYRAYDPDLDRAVALKLVRIMYPGLAGERARTRLVREAQALARVSHPNVIAVYDVGTHGTDVFVATELVEGVTLREWLQRHCGASWRDRLDLLLAAGRGLSAAHRAGLVHRDVKPENIMVGDDGRVRVLDFGLARAAAGSVDRAADTAPDEQPSATPDGASPRPSLLSHQLTREGALVGTPAYMAPEQHLGEPADARADQFSFCVVAFHTLYGLRPFDSNDLRALRAAVVAGELAPAPSPTPVPRAIYDLLARGLARLPEHRFPSMEALLDALARAGSRRPRRALAVALAGTLAVAAGAIVLAGGASPPERCRGNDTRIEAMWSPTRRHQVERGLQATGRAHAAATFTRVAAIVDDYRTRWVAARAEACERERDDQAETALDLRMNCLDQRLHALTALIDTLADNPSGAAADGAIRAARALPAIADCADVDTLARAYPRPQDPTLRAHIEVLEAKLDVIETRLQLGQLDGVAAELEALMTEVDETDHPPLMARVRFAMASSQELAVEDHEQASTNLREAVRLAAKTADHRLAAKAWVRLMWLEGHTRGHEEEALALRPAVEAAIARAGDQPELHAQFLGQAGMLAGLAGRYDEAAADHERALAIVRERLGPEHHLLYRVKFWQAGLLKQQGRYQEARAMYKEILDHYEAEYGPEHLWLAAPIQNRANVLSAQGEYLDALAEYRRALAIEEANRGERTTYAALIRGNIGLTLYNLDRYSEARDEIARALAIEVEIYGEDHPQVGDTQRFMGTVLLAEGEYDQAEVYLRKALAIHARAPGPDHPKYAYGLLFLARASAGRGAYAEASESFRQARDIITATLGPKHNNVAAVTIDLAQSLADQGLYDDAMRELDHALRIHAEIHGEDHPHYADTLHVRAGIELDRGRHREARDLLARVLALYERDPETSPTVLSAVVSDLGRAHLELGQLDTALPLLEHGLELGRDAPGTPHQRASLRFHLARALAASGTDLARARRLAEQARDLVAGRPGADGELHGEITAWLARR